MQTLQFQCRYCGNAMEVGGELLGREVNCPHCQHVVLAPETAAPAPALDSVPQPVEPRERVQRRVRQESVFTTYLLAFLIPYAILMTAVAVWFYYKSQQNVSPLEMLPDWPRDNDQPARQGASYYRVDDSQPLPERLRVGLNESVQIGDLEVTPLKVERRPLVFRYERKSRPPEKSTNAALVVILRVRNTSADVTFAPNDRFFNRQWRPGLPEANRPYTCLEVGAERFYGGPCPWRGRRTSSARSSPDPEVEGTECRTELKPGGEMTIIVCTDPDNPEVLAGVAAAEAPLLWRVQLRRGLVRIRGREETATAVVGVTFCKGDIVSELSPS